MECWEYKTQNISIEVDAEGTPQSERLHRIINREAAKGWEVADFQFYNDINDDHHSFWILYRKRIESCLSPYLNKDFSEEQLDSIYMALTPNNRTHREPITTDEVDYFLEHLNDEFQNDYKIILTYARYIKEMTKQEAVEEIKKFL